MAAKKVPKHNKFTLENFLLKIGTIVLNIDSVNGNIPIIHPRTLSLKLSFSPKVGNKGDIKK